MIVFKGLMTELEISF